MKTNVRIGDVLVELGYLTPQQIEFALGAQKQDPSKRLGEILLQEGFITEDQLLSALAERLALQVLDLTQQEINLTVAATIPRALATRYHVIAIAVNDNTVTLAVNDPLDFYGIEDVKSFFDKQCELVLCKRAEIDETIRRAYSEIEARTAADSVKVTAQEQEDEEDLSIANPSLAPIVNLVNSIIAKGYLEGASDIHFEPFEKQICVRLRVDGQLLGYMELDTGLTVSIATRIKILAGLDIAERRAPQDGNFKMVLGGNDIGVRVSVMPTPYGEKIVLRFLSRDIAMDHSDQYGMNRYNYDKARRILQNPHGMVYITGPTGSGKTTTLYMMVEDLGKEPINVSTIEDPIERKLKGITQVQVNPRAGLTFESGLRSMLRQDPDVILVGETRDSETAQIAVSAAITGHLVLSTLHTNDAISTIVRLQNMGVPSYLVANSLVGVVAQRLVKKVCPFCKEEYTPTDEEKKLLPDVTRLVRGKGCKACNQSGYKGRIAVHEVLEIDQQIREMIANEVPTGEIYRYVRDHQLMRSLQQDIAMLVADGVTTVEELRRHTAWSI